MLWELTESCLREATGSGIQWYIKLSHICVTLTDYNSRTKHERNTKLGMHGEITSAYHPQVRPAITEGVHM